MRLVLVAALLVIMVGLQELHAHFPSDLGSRAALAFGFLLLCGFLLGEILARFVPRITGYLFAGMICGPHVLGLVGADVVSHLALVNELALVLIALTAGGELEMGRLRARIKAIVSIGLFQTGIVFVVSAGGLWLLQDWIGLLSGLNGTQVISVVALLGIIATATSPSTAVAVILEARSKGPMTETVLGVTVLKDILVLAGFSLVLALAMPQFATNPQAASHQAGLGFLMLEVLLSLLAGGVFGALMIAYLRFVGRQTVLFVVGSAFLLISLSGAFGLDVLLVAVAAGFAVRNFSKQGVPFLQGLERAAGPIFLIFFCLAGAGLDLGVLASLWHVALFYICLRTSSTWVGTWLGAALVKDDPGVRNHAWTGFIGQAGVSLGLAALLRARLPGIGPAIADLIVGGIVVNQVLGPVVFRWALRRVGEARETRAQSSK